MEGIVFIEPQPYQADFYFANVKIVTVYHGSVTITPEGGNVMNSWRPEKCKELAEYIAPFIAKMLGK